MSVAAYPLSGISCQISLAGYPNSEESEPEEGDIEVSRVPINEAIQALEVLKLFTIQQDNDDTLISQALDRLGRDLLLKKQHVGRQSTIDVFFKSR